jgi:uncharacterized protein
MQEGFLLPELDDDSAGFWEGTADGELRVQACTGCGRLRFPPRPMCPSCQSLAWRWQAMSGRGAVWSYVVAHPPLLPAYAEFAPYPVVVVELEEDPSIRMVGNVIAEPGGPINGVEPADLRIGAPVTVTFEEIAEGVTLPRWIYDPRVRGGST